MENITLGQITAAIAIILSISGFCIAIIRWYSKTFSERFDNIENDIRILKDKTKEQDNEIKDSKEERLVLLNGVLACLKGMHNDLKCNGPVTQGIKDIEDYLIKKSHN